MTDKIIAAGLKKARLAAGMSQKQAYERLGVKQSTFSSWERGVSQPDILMFLKLCDIYKITDIINWFSVGKGYQNINNSEILQKLAVLPSDRRAAVLNSLDFEWSNYINHIQNQNKRKIRVYLQPAAAGFGNYIDDELFEEMSLSAPNGADFGVRISGDSMEPQIKDGEIVFVQKTSELAAGEIGIFALDSTAYCKRLEIHNGEPYLVSVNPAYCSIPVKGNLVIYGRVLL